MSRYPAELFAPPHGNFVLLLREGRAIAGGAFKRYDSETAEVKRMWTDASLRRQGLAQRILDELEAQAIRQGYSRIYLTTGFRQPEAKGLICARAILCSSTSTSTQKSTGSSLSRKRWQRLPCRPRHALTTHATPPKRAAPPP